MMLAETETNATFEMLPDEVRMHITHYLDVNSLCFFAATSRRSLGNALGELQKYRQFMLTQFQLRTRRSSTFIYTAYNKYKNGENRYGQLGQEHYHHSLQQIENVPGAILQVAASGYHSVVLTVQGLFACGDNTDGQLGLGCQVIGCTQLTRVEGAPEAVLQVIAGDFYTLLLTAHGLYACGNNEYGQLGLGHNTTCYSLTRVAKVSGTILQVAAGGSHTLVLTDQGLFACGNNNYGQLGLGHNINRNNLTEIKPVPGKVLQLAAGGYHSIVLTDQGLYVCGFNKHGQLGFENNNDCNQLTQVTSLPGTILQVAAGLCHTLVLTDQGLYACGKINDGLLRSSDDKSSIFTLVRGLPIALKKWFSRMRHIDHLITISASNPACEQKYEDELPLATKRARFG